MKKAVDTDGKIPTELRKNKDENMKEMEMADDHTIAARTHIDDEYEMAKFRDPKILVTTSRDPS